MAMSAMIGEEETQRQQENRIRRQREELEQARAKFREQMAAGARKTFIFLFGAAVVLYFTVNGLRFQDATSRIGQRITTQANAHNALKQKALNYENEVNEVTE